MAHMDEVGFLVRHIDENGYVYIHNVGGYFDQSVLTQRLIDPDRRGRGPRLHRDEVGAYPAAGRARPDGPARRHVHRRRRVEPRRGRGRWGCARALPVTYRDEVRDVYERHAALPGESVRRPRRPRGHHRGPAAAPEPRSSEHASWWRRPSRRRSASAAPRWSRLRPTPTSSSTSRSASRATSRSSRSKALSQEELGKGAGVFVFDGSMIPNNKYIDWILKLADENTIAVQLESVTGYGEDAAMIQKSARGVPAVNIGVPTRYGAQPVRSHRSGRLRSHRGPRGEDDRAPHRRGRSRAPGILRCYRSSGSRSTRRFWPSGPIGI